ncbi:hypothetical protein TNIN_171841 [Trichonephila inaurata madagascariensis]|uniref:Uncharacterized protein n=1 Tax=Trichonephila inaurata madagascariensis TaxID=2747483 RepID=A0A8X6XWV2_9ARAC|nr:hypothetical protein TNIN_171841 [Trichonephila inaurata madagascariensis]
MDRLYCEVCQLTFENFNTFKSHICSKIKRNEFHKAKSYEMEVSGREVEHVNSMEQIQEEQFIKSSIASTNTLIDDDVYRNLNDFSFELSENIVGIIKELDFSNTCFDNCSQISELRPSSFQPATDKGCNQTADNCRSLNSADYFRDLDDALVDKVLSYNFPSEFLRHTAVQNSVVKTKPTATGESVEDLLPILEGTSFPHDQLQESHSFYYLSDQAFESIESDTNEQVLPSSEFFFNLIPSRNGSNNIVYDDNCTFPIHLCGRNPSDIRLDQWPPANFSNFDRVTSATDSSIFERNNNFLYSDFLLMDSSNDSREGANNNAFLEDQNQCIVDSNDFLPKIPSFESKDTGIFNCKKTPLMSSEVNFNEKNKFHMEDRNSKIVEYAESNSLETGFIREKDLDKCRPHNSTKVFPYDCIGYGLMKINAGVDLMTNEF